MKNTKNIIFIVLVGLIAAGQVGYFVKVYSQDKMEIQSVASELESTERYLKQLQERVAMLPETKKELELMTAQKTAMLNTIPLFESDSRQDSEFMRYIRLKDVIDISCNQVESAEQVVDESIHVSNYELSFVGRYKDVRDFVDTLNASYQIINVSELTVDNAIQDEAREKNSEEGKLNKLKQHFGADLPQVVDATIKFKIYSRVNGEDLDEIYTPSYLMQVNSENIFERVDKDALMEDEEEVSPSLGETDNKPQEDNNTTGKFTLNIGDMFTSGDTYKLGGPGDGGYVGLISQVNTEIKLTVSTTGYQMQMTDANGQTKETKVNMPLGTTKLDIISTMRQLDDVMPSIHIYVYNYTPNIMNIKISGSMLDNIHIFNEEDNKVNVGQTKGNIRVS